MSHLVRLRNDSFATCANGTIAEKGMTKRNLFHVDFRQTGNWDYPISDSFAMFHQMQDCLTCSVKKRQIRHGG